MSYYKFDHILYLMTKGCGHSVRDSELGITKTGGVTVPAVVQCPGEQS